MKHEEILEIKQKIEAGKLDSFAAFTLGVYLQKNDDVELIESINRCFEIRNMALGNQRKRAELMGKIQDGTLRFIRNLFRLSGSKFDISRGYFSSDSINEGIADFQKIVGIEKISSRDHTEYSVNVDIVFNKNGLAFMVFKGLINIIELTLSNDSGEDYIVVGQECFDNASYYFTQKTEDDELYKLEERLYFVNSIDFDDFHVFSDFVMQINKLDRQWLEKNILLSNIANDGGRTILKLIQNK